MATPPPGTDLSKLFTGGIVKSPFWYQRDAEFLTKWYIPRMQSESRLMRKGTGKTITYNVTFDFDAPIGIGANIRQEIENMKIAAMIKYARAQTAAFIKSLRKGKPTTILGHHFVFQQVYPDMVAKGFGFGRLAICTALVKLNVKSWDRLMNITNDEVEVIKDAPNVGPKVWAGFVRYMAARGRLPGGITPETTAILTPPAS